jgi:hypothetical protein
MAVNINIYKTAAYSDAYSEDGAMDDPIWPRSGFSWDGSAGETRDIELFARNDGTTPALSVEIEVVDIVGGDESTWSKLATTQAGLSGAAPGNSINVGDLAPAATATFWLRITVPADTDPEDKTDLRVRATASVSSSSSSSSASSQSISSSSSSVSSESVSSSSSESVSSSSSSSKIKQPGIPKGEPFTWSFKLVDETDKWTEETGKTPTVTIAQMNTGATSASFVALAGAPTVYEQGSGWYFVTASGPDMNYDIVVLKAEASGCKQADQVIRLV